MIHWKIYLAASVPISLLAFAGWILSLARDKVGHVDAMWPLFISMSAFVYALFVYDLHARSAITLLLTTLWAFRLCAYLSWRHTSQRLDQRHQDIAQSLAPHYWFKSLYHVFLLYGLLAWLVSLPLFGAIQQLSPLSWLDYLGITLVIIGLIIESIADWQLIRFKQHNPSQEGLLQNGLWAYCRHPNYLGELLVWFGFYSIALAAQAWWSILSPLVITYLIFIGSGIPAIERSMIQSKAEYQTYQQSTPMILPIKSKR